MMASMPASRIALRKCSHRLSTQSARSCSRRPYGPILGTGPGTKGTTICFTRTRFHSAAQPSGVRGKGCGSSPMFFLGNTKLTEALAYTGDGLLGAHTLVREDFPRSRSYAYAPLSRRLATEALNLDATHTLTNASTFDNAVPSGPGVLTLIQESTNPSIQQPTNRWSGSADNFSRISTEPNTVSHRAAYGRLNGPPTVTISVDRQEMPASVNYTTSHDCTNRCT